MKRINTSPDLNRRALLSTLAALPILSAPIFPISAQAQTTGDPLPSWNDGPAKQAIIAFVKETTDPGSSKFVPPEARIATFDQDGTLWVEHPLYTQLVYCLDRVPVVVKAPRSVRGSLSERPQRAVFSCRVRRRCRPRRARPRAGRILN